MCISIGIDTLQQKGSLTLVNYIVAFLCQNAAHVQLRDLKFAQCC